MSTLALQPKDNYKVIDGERVEEELLLYVLKCAAEFMKTRDIVTSVNNRYGAGTFFNSAIRVSKVVAEPGYKVLVNNFRGAYLSRVRDVSIAHKRVRLDDLEEVRGKMVEKLRINDMADDGQVREYIAVSRELNSTLASAREEIEGKSIVFNQLNVMNGDFGDKSDDELSNRRDELIRKAARTISTEAVNGRTVRADGAADGTEEAEVR